MSNSSLASIAVTLADQVAAFLNGQTIGDVTLSAERKLIPIRNLSTVKTLRAMVVPHSFESKIVARGGLKERTVRIDVGVMKRASESELDGLLALTQAIGDKLEGKKFDAGMCVEVAYAPIYNVEVYLEQQSFFAVIVATMKVL